MINFFQNEGIKQGIIMLTEFIYFSVGVIKTNVLLHYL